MPRQYWGTSPNENSLFYVRKSRLRRWGAVCFHCRTTVTMHQDNAGVDVFNEHYDVDRPPTSRLRGSRRIGPNQEYEVCPGSDYPAIPLAYKWMDGTPMTRY